MNTLTAKRLLMEKRQWWEPLAEHASEGATVDAQANFTFRLASQKMEALDQNEKRMLHGTFGRCERCGAALDDGRLETILDNEWHYCTDCASKPATAHVTQKSASKSNGYRNYSRSALPMAY